MSKTSRSLVLTAAIVAALAVGYGVGQNMPMTDAPAPAEKPVPTPVVEGKGRILYYRNPMGLPDTSPVPKQDAMGMDYVPVYASEAQAERGTVTLPAERIQKLGVRTESVERRSLSHPVRALGTVQIDETRQTIVAPRFEGWIGKLRVNATGQQVKKDEALFDFYSPELIQIETDYLSFVVADLGKGYKNGSIEKLRTLAVPEDEIARLQKEKTVNHAITLRATSDGTVLDKQAVEGMKFSSGDTLYRLADLSNVWALVDVYEQDLAQMVVGQSAVVTLNAYAGKSFEGKVGFIYPAINKETRTAKLRIDLPNPTGELRTDMYANVEIGTLPRENVLTVAAESVLNSGARKTVLLDLGEGRFKPQPVTTGVEGDGRVEIIDGVKEGDRVVTSASFLIDAESSIRAALQDFSTPEKNP